MVGPPTPPMPGPPPGQVAAGVQPRDTGGAMYPGEYASLESRQAPQGTLWSPGAQQQTGPKQEIPPWMMPQISGWGGASYQHAHPEYKEAYTYLSGVDWGPSYTGELLMGRMSHRRGSDWTTVHATGVHGEYKYKPVPGDEVDELLAEYLEIHPNPVKFVRVAPNVYIWGKHRIVLKKTEAKKGNAKLKLSTNGGLFWESLSKFMANNMSNEVQLMLCAHPPNCGIAYEPWLADQRWPRAFGAPPHRPTIPFGQAGWLNSLTCPIIRTEPVSGHWALMPMLEPCADPRRPWM